MIRAALFDLDGTLVSSLPELAAGVRRLARSKHLPLPQDEDVGAMIGAGVRVLLERLYAWWRAAGVTKVELGKPELEFERVLGELVDIWAAMDGSLISEIPGAFDGVRALKRAGIQTWLVTNKERRLTEAFLSERNLTGLFDGLVAGGDCDRLKPHPDMILKALKDARVSAAEAVMFGDSCNDALAARAAGVRALLVESGYNEGVPLRVWAGNEGFNEVFPGVKEACAVVLSDRNQK